MNYPYYLCGAIELSSPRYAGHNESFLFHDITQMKATSLLRVHLRNKNRCRWSSMAVSLFRTTQNKEWTYDLPNKVLTNGSTLQKTSNIRQGYPCRQRLTCLRRVVASRQNGKSGSNVPNDFRPHTFYSWCVGSSEGCQNKIFWCWQCEEKQHNS